MKSHTGFDNLDFKAFRTLLDALLPAGSLCALSDAAGQIHHADEGFEHGIVGKVLGKLASEPPANLRGLPRIVRVRIPPKSWLAAPLRTEDRQTLGSWRWRP
jgi:hypothetical protein